MSESFEGFRFRISRCRHMNSGLMTLNRARLKIAYFINHYPKVSHSFIRREILALERQGFEVQRIAIHGWADPLPDEEDQRELAQTRYVLRHGAWALLLPTLRALVTSPARFFAA